MTPELKEKVLKATEDLGVAALVPYQEIIMHFDDPNEMQAVSFYLVETMIKFCQFDGLRSVTLEQSCLKGDFTSDIELLNGSVIRLGLTPVGMIALASDIQKAFGDKPLGKVAYNEWYKRAAMASMIMENNNNRNSN